MIGIICAEKEETANLTKLLKTKIIEFNGFKFYVGQINNKQIVISFSGVGKVNAAATCMNMIINFSPKIIFNFGLCGSCCKGVLPGSTIIADAFQYSDVDLTHLNYPLNQIPDEPIKIECSQSDLSTLRKLIDKPVVGTICSSDTFIDLKNIEAFPCLANKEVVGYEMEAMALASVCKKTKTKFYSIKVVSDNISLSQQAKDQYKNNFKELAKSIEKIAYKVLDFYTKEETTNK